MASYTCYAMTLEEDIGDVYAYPSPYNMLLVCGICDRLSNPRYKLTIYEGKVWIYQYIDASIDATICIRDIEDVPSEVRKAFLGSWFFTIDCYEPVDGVQLLSKGSYDIASKEKVDPIEFVFAHKDGR